mgnify:CR=1 FL=1
MQSTILKNFLVKIIYRGFPVSTDEFIKIQVGASCIHAWISITIEILSNTFY